MIHTYTFRKQAGVRGYFASVTFDITSDESKDQELIINYLADSRWEIACRSGILFFLDKFPFPGQLRIDITDVRWLPVDTSNLVVVYTTLKGLYEFFKVSDDRLKFNDDDLVFSFPVGRKLQHS
ncbi:hypothetical protein ACLI1A_08535 [Flavobacterium sp. RHBU_3]|uniref:hypothetical protein n=1 Tax=Flavobacterium sp. RHBU_3 TaxID=3391184 RepID=UPI003984F73C